MQVPARRTDGLWSFDAADSASVAWWPKKHWRSAAPWARAMLPCRRKLGKEDQIVASGRPRLVHTALGHNLGVPQKRKSATRGHLSWNRGQSSMLQNHLDTAHRGSVLRWVLLAPCFLHFGFGTRSHHLTAVGSSALSCVVLLGLCLLVEERVGPHRGCAEKDGGQSIDAAAIDEAAAQQ